MKVKITQDVELTKVGNVFVLSENGKFKTNMSWNECKELESKLKGFRMLTCQESYDLCQTNKDFKEKIMIPYWIWNTESFDGSQVKEKTVIDELIRTKKLKLPKNAKVYKGSIWFDDEGKEASVGSFWVTDVGCFGADADRPTYWDGLGLCCFLKLRNRK